MLARLETFYKQGDRHALWWALVHCARWDQPMPEWVRRAIDEAELKNTLGMLRNFSDVFGRPLTVRQAENLNRDYDKALAVAELAEQADKDGIGRGEEWFVSTGAKIGEGKTRVKELLAFSRMVFGRPRQKRKAAKVA